MNDYWDNLNELNILCKLARTTTSIDTLRELATSWDWRIRHYVTRNPHSTEDVMLLAHAYGKFGKLTK